MPSSVTRLPTALLCVSLLAAAVAVGATTGVDGVAAGPVAGTAQASAEHAPAVACQSIPDRSPASAGQWPGDSTGPTANDNLKTNVSVAVWTVPLSTFGDFRTPAAVQSAIERGVLTPATAGWNSEGRDRNEITSRDTLALMVAVTGNASAFFDALNQSAGSSPEAKLATMLDDPDLTNRGFDLRVGNGMCEYPLNWSATADIGSLNVVPDRTNETLYIAIDTRSAVIDRGDPDAERLYGWNSIEVSPPGEPGKSDRFGIDIDFGEVEFAGQVDKRFELEASEDERLTGKTNVAPSTNVTISITAEDDTWSWERTVQVDRTGGFSAPINLSTIPPGTELDVDCFDCDQLTATVVQPSTPTPSPTDSPTPTASPTPTPPPETPPPSATITQSAADTTTETSPSATTTTTPGFGVAIGLAALAFLVVGIHRQRR